MIDKLKRRLGDQVAAFEDADLLEFLETIKTEYNLIEGKHDSMILDLALCTCYLRLATDKATYFKYTQATESVDKTMTPKMFMNMYEFLWESVQERLPSKVDTFQIKKESDSGEEAE